MEYKVSQLRKVQHMLDIFADPNCSITDHHLRTALCQFKKNYELVRSESLYTEWVMKVVTLWHIGSKTPTTNLSAFTLNLASVLSGDEIIFCSLNNNNFFVKLINVAKARDSDAPSVVQSAYINLLWAVLEHKAGVEWIMATVFWEDILNFSLNSQNTYLIRESRNFISKLLERGVEQDEKFCTSVVKKIMCPLGDNVYQAMKTLTSDEDMCKSINPTLQMIGTILEYFLEKSMPGQKQFRVVLIFLENFHLEKRISDLLLIARNQYLLFDLGRVMFLMQFLELYINYVSLSTDIQNIHNSIKKIVDIFNVNLQRGNFDNVLKFSYFGQFYWNLLGSKLPCFMTEKQNEPLEFAHELTMILLFPLFYLMVKYCTKNMTSLEVELRYENDNVRSSFASTIFKSMSQDTMRILFIWRECLIRQPDLCEITTKSILYLLKSRKYIKKRELVVLVCQMLIYLLKDLAETMKNDEEKLRTLRVEGTFFALLLEGISTFLQDFKITWKDAIEVFDVLDITFGFLEMTSWSDKVVVKALNLIQISIDKYMAPNLAFLVDDSDNSTTGVLAPLLLSKLEDSSPDVKNAALEIVQTISKLSNSKFPSLQKVLMDSDLPNLVVQMSTNDSESFVRATAIKCLQEMIQVEDIWNNVLKSQDLSQKMRNILLNETEGIVRVEAATFMCKAYEHQQFPEETLDKVYDTMIHSSTSDLHWEVKVRALGFWDQVITSQLHNQGMIDGTFPTVTFSKEHRKIVTLTDAEIKKRLVKVLNQLSSIGCLGVLTSAIKDDCDMEVSKTAVNITQRIVELLKKYNIQGEVGAQVSPQPTEHGMSSSTSVSSGISADDVMGSPVSSNPDINEEVIDQIVNSKDVTLLRSVYAPSDYGSVHNYDIQVKKIVTPNEFLIFTQQDLNVIITEKKNWLNGIEDLGSLLDDMLKTYDDDINNMDCY